VVARPGLGAVTLGGRAEPSAAWVDAVARKGMAAGALISDEQERVLLVEPTYEPTWEVPGGVVAAVQQGSVVELEDGSPRAAAW